LLFVGSAVPVMVVAGGRSVNLLASCRQTNQREAGAGPWFALPEHLRGRKCSSYDQQRAIEEVASCIEQERRAEARHLCSRETILPAA
jgi:hypothetical protein